LKRIYDEILEKVAEQNPLPKKEKGKRGKQKKGKIRALMERFREYKDEICHFADNAFVLFTNNQA